MSNLSNEKEQSEDPNRKYEDILHMAKTEPAKPNTQNNEVNPTNVSIRPGSIPMTRNHKSHRVYSVLENNMYHIVIFRTRVTCESKKNATNITYDDSFTYIKESVEFEEKLFSKRIQIRQRLPTKLGRSLGKKHYLCVVDECGNIFARKNQIKV
ncbi:hypothetical protein RF11_11879 [Thelohanellus kitauei]|uniref:Uncharacterized protein n=1 Tax=Thelohanellus kitauei TaxID=669202 RepID=A0A0C2I5H8_THEKT|nr:hypothetical protein RF11_11879 [Thelohanellus kitauei]